MSDAAQIDDAPPRPQPRARRSKAETAAVLVKAIRDLARRGVYQPRLEEIAQVSGEHYSMAGRRFGDKIGLCRHVARHYFADVVDTLELSDKARAALSERDEKTIAMAVLGGRRLEAGQ